MEFSPSTGTHTITIVDQKGNKISQNFNILN